VAVVQETTFSETVQGIGTLRAQETVEITPEVAGMVREIHFKEGQRVQRGDLLFTLDDSKLIRELGARQASLEAARARLEKAQKTAERIATLYRDRIVSEQRWDQAETELETAEAELRRRESAVALIRERLQHTRIHAPFKGMMSEGRVDPGDYTVPGQVLATLYGTEVIEIEVKIPDRHMGRIRKGQQAEVMVDAFPNRPFSGAVTFVSPPWMN
jgi:membrane fusion protein (multidrug efflux system)